MTRTATLVALPVVLVAAVVALVLRGGDDGPGPSQARVEVLDGAVEVRTAAGEVEVVTDDAAVEFGDAVVVRSGSATLELADGSAYELRHRDGVGSEVLVGAPPRLVAGDALVVAGYPARLQVGAATLSAQGAVRVDAEEEVAAAYEGRTGVAGVGEVRELRGLRQLVLVPGAVPEPVVFDGSDPWDRRFLGEAIAFGERLEALARGYTSDLPPGAGRSADFFRTVVPALADEREFGADLLDPAMAPGETLVGAAISVQGRRDTFRERWAEVFSFRAAGAAWGLVALDQGVSSAPVLDTIELAIGTPVTSPTTEPSSAPTTTAAPGAPAPPSGGGPTTTTAPPSPPPEPSGGLLDPVVDPVSELLSGLLERLLAAP